MIILKEMNPQTLSDSNRMALKIALFVKIVRENCRKKNLEEMPLRKEIQGCALPLEIPKTFWAESALWNKILKSRNNRQVDSPVDLRNRRLCRQ